MQNVEGKVAFITGGASGIGLGIALACARAGMRVAVTDIRPDHLESAQGYFRERGLADGLLFIRLDVTDREAFARAADAAERAFGRVHVLCNNAGVGILGPLAEARFADWDWAVDVMIGGVVNGIQTLLGRILRHGEGGHIVTTSSMGGMLPLPGSVLYSTVKAAVIGLSEAMRGELEGDRIGVSVFCPGPVATNIHEIGRMRPPKYRPDSGYAAREAEIALRPGFASEMSIEECGERVLRGIRRNDLYIFTHREFKEGVRERMRAILASFPREAVNRARADEFSFLISNPVFRQVLESRGRKRRAAAGNDAPRLK